MAIVRLNLSISENGTEVYSGTQSLAADESGWQRYELANSVTDQAIPFNLSTGVTTVQVILLTSDKAISWRANAADTAITLSANRVHLLYGTSLTALLLSNSSGSTANVRIYIAGT
jgi:hypothetical protein